MTYPEHEKLKAVSDTSQAIGEFLQWCEEQGWHLAEYDSMAESLGVFSDDHQLWPIRLGIEDILARYFDIDRDRLEAEKRAMLDEIRSKNG
jgi:hypothetical protein